MKLKCLAPSLAPTVAAALALVLVACGGGSGRADGTAAPPVRAEADVRIGSLEGEGADVFGSVAGLAVDAAGRILALDTQASEVRVFDPAGLHLFSFGRRGAGPGELGSACCMAFGADSLLWIRDGGNGRYSAYRVGPGEAEYVTSVRMSHSDVNRWAPLTFDAEGQLIDIGARPYDGSMATFRFHRGPDGGVVTREVMVPEPPAGAVPVHTVQRQMQGGLATLFLHQPFGPRHIVAHGPGGTFADAVSGSYEVRVYNSAGEPIHTVSRTDLIGPALSPGERERAAATLESQARHHQMPLGEVPFGVPARKPILRHLAFDDRGNLWVFLEAAEDAPRRADIYDSAGAFVRTVEWTERLESFPLVLRPDVLVGVVRDSLDVQYVTRLQVR